MLQQGIQTENKKLKFNEISKFESKSSWHTVCALAFNGLRCIGVRFWTRLSHRTICPEYVPPRIKFGWNLAKHDDITALWQWKMSSAVSFLNLVFHTMTTPSGSFGDSCKHSPPHRHILDSISISNDIIGTYNITMIWGKQQFGIISWPVHCGDATIFRPAIIVEHAIQR